MNKKEYIEYLIEETQRAEGCARELNLSSPKLSSLTSVVDSMRGFLVYLLGAEAYNIKDELIFPEEPCSIEVYAIERSLKDMCWCLYENNSSIVVFYAFCTQILRAILAVQLEEKGVAASCIGHECDDYTAFSIDKATKKDIKNAVFEHMEFKCPDTRANFYFTSFEDVNSFNFLK